MIISDYLSQGASVSLTLSDKKVISGLYVNGNNLVSKTELTPSMFEGKLSHIVMSVTANGEQTIKEFDYCELVQIMEYDGEWYLLISQIPPEEMRMRSLEANQEYLAMMSDVEL